MTPRHGACGSHRGVVVRAERGPQEGFMKKLGLSFPQLGFIVGTRAALAAGVGLLASKKLRPAARRRVGVALVAVGALATIPALLFVRRGASTTPAETTPSVA